MMDTERKSIKEELKLAKKPHVALRLLLVALKFIVPIAVFSVGYFGFEHLKNTRPVVAKRPPQEQIWSVRSEPINQFDFQPTLKLYGEVVAGRKVDLRPLVSGQVISVNENLTEGGLIKTGDTLVQVDKFDYEGALTEANTNLMEARARLNESIARSVLEKDAVLRAQEQLDLAQRDLKRAEDLRNRRTLSEKSVDDRRLLVSQREQSLEQRKNTLVIEEAKIEQQKAVIERLEWRVRKAKRDLEHTKLVAPFSGYVTGANAELGRMLSTNDVVATLLDQNHLDVRFTLTDKQFGRILSDKESIEGRKVTVIWRIGDEPRRYDAVIERVVPEIAAENGGIELFALIDTKGDVALRAGAFVEVEVPDKLFKNVARLPSTSIYGTDRVYLIKDKRLEEMQVNVVGLDGPDVLVRGDFENNDKVVVSRIAEIASGLLVEEIEQ